LTVIFVMLIAYVSSLVQGWFLITVVCCTLAVCVSGMRNKMLHLYVAEYHHFRPFVLLPSLFDPVLYLRIFVNYLFVITLCIWRKQLFCNYLLFIKSWSLVIVFCHLFFNSTTCLWHPFCIIKHYILLLLLLLFFFLPSVSMFPREVWKKLLKNYYYYYYLFCSSDHAE